MNTRHVHAGIPVTITTTLLMSSMHGGQQSIAKKIQVHFFQHHSLNKVQKKDEKKTFLMFN